MIYKILFCRLSFNLSNGGDVFGDWNHRLENWMVLISNLFRCWTFFFDWLCILFQYVEDKEYPCGEIKEEKGIQVICQSVLWLVGNFDLLATAEWKEYKEINEMEILTISPFGPFGGCQTWKEYQPALENRNVLFLHQRWASKKRVNRKGKLNVPRLYIVSLAKVPCWFWKRTDTKNVHFFFSSGWVSKKRVNRKGTCPITMNQKHWWYKSLIDNRDSNYVKKRF